MRSSVLERARVEEPARLTQCWLLLCTTYATIVSGAFLLAVAEHTMGYAVMAAVFCAGHAFLVGPKGVACLPGAVGKLLAIGALAFGLLQAGYTTVEVSYGLAHFLVLVQLIKLYGPHTVRDLRLIHVAAIFILLVASMLALDILYLPAFLLAAISLMGGLAALSMFPPAAGPQSDAARRARVWATWRHLASALLLPVMAVFGVTAVLFVLLPRVHFAGDRYGRLAEKMVGFSASVSLHEVGRLRQGDQIVMRAQFGPADASQGPPVALSRMLMRGQTLPFYREGRWASYAAVPMITGVPPMLDEETSDFASIGSYLLGGTPVPVRAVRQKITIETRPSRTLFALYRLAWAEGHGAGREQISSQEHTIELSDPIEPGDSYEAVSIVPQFAPSDLRRAGTPRPDRRSWFLWYVPESIRPTLEGVARDALERYPAKTDYDRVMSVERYLTESGLFRYTLDLPPLGDGDPIEEFLTRTREGSCEQFSTALALILRVWGIPTRLSIGFKDGDYDQATGTYVFRDKHAHAWVEVFFTDRGWVEFDPTPGLASPAAVASESRGVVNGLLEKIQSLVVRISRRVRGEWTGNVIGYSRAKQRRIFEGISSAAAALAARAAGIVGPLWPGMPGTGMVQVAVLVVLLTLVGMGLYLLARWVQAGAARADVPPQVRRTLWFYLETLRILRRKGVLREEHLTPREFVAVAAGQLVCGEQGDPAPREALELVTDLYYQVRFGGREATAQQIAAIRRALDVLRRATRAVPDPLAAPAAPGGDLP